MGGGEGEKTLEYSFFGSCRLLRIQTGLVLGVEFPGDVDACLVVDGRLLPFDEAVLAQSRYVTVRIFAGYTQLIYGVPGGNKR